MNTQIVCDDQLLITDMFIGFPGSVHDARVFRNSTLPEYIARLPADKHLFGDGGYILKPGLETRTRSKTAQCLATCMNKITYEVYGLLTTNLSKMYLNMPMLYPFIHGPKLNYKLIHRVPIDLLDDRKCQVPIRIQASQCASPPLGGYSKPHFHRSASFLARRMNASHP